MVLDFCLLEDFYSQFQFLYFWLVCLYFLILPGLVLEEFVHIWESVHYFQVVSPWSFSSVQSLSAVRLFATPWIACQASLSITNSRTSLRLMSIESVMPSSHLILVPFSSCPQSLPASKSFPMSQLFAWGCQSPGVPALASFLPKKSQGWSPLKWTGWIPCSPRDSQESSPTPQFKSISSSALSLLHSPTLTSIHDHRKNHSLD